MSSIIEACRPREGILQGTFNPEVFTASLSQVVAHYRGRGGRIDNLYTDAEQFFRDGTAPTEGIKFVLREALLRALSNSAGMPSVRPRRFESMPKRPERPCSAAIWR